MEYEARREVEREGRDGIRSQGSQDRGQRTEDRGQTTDADLLHITDNG